MFKKMARRLKTLAGVNVSPIEESRRFGVEIGNGVRLNCLPHWGSEPWLISVGNHSEISVNVTFITHDGATWCFRDQERYKSVIRYGRISIGEHCFIGANSTIMPNVKIGDYVIVGAGAVVANDLKSHGVYAGVPARYICSLEQYAEKCLAETPSYDTDAYIRDKRAEVMRVYPKR